LSADRQDFLMTDKSPGKVGDIMNRQCDSCFKEKVHYHIIVKRGVVKAVLYFEFAGNGCLDRELEKDEWFVEYIDDSILSRTVNKLVSKLKAVKRQPDKHAPDTWLIPRVYKGETRSRDKSHRVIQEREKYMAWTSFGRDYRRIRGGKRAG
jgi:hypothetical protein